MKIYPVQELFNGRIALSPCPQGHSQLQAEIAMIKKLDVSLVISMLTTTEQRKHGLLHEQEICKQYDIQYLNFPIKDEVADSDYETMKFVQLISAELKRIINNSDKKILFHCRGGVGRSSMMIALVMSHLGEHNIDDVFTCITSARGEMAPESPYQLQWVRKLATTLNKLKR